MVTATAAAPGIVSCAIECPGEPRSRRSPRGAPPARPPPSGGSDVAETTCVDYEGLKEPGHRPTVTAVKIGAMEKELQLYTCMI